MKKIQTIAILAIVIIFVSILFLPTAYSKDAELGIFQSADIEYPSTLLLGKTTFKYTDGTWKFKDIWGNFIPVVTNNWTLTEKMKNLQNKLTGKTPEEGFSILLDEIKHNTSFGYIFVSGPGKTSYSQKEIRDNIDRYQAQGNKLIYAGAPVVSPSPTLSPSPGTSPNSSGSPSNSASPGTSTSPGSSTSPSATASSSTNGIFGNTLPEYISNIYNWSIGIAAGLAVIMLIYAGYLYVTSAGNPESINLAKEVIIGAIAGFVFLVLAALILRFVM
jgi:hypothetical protein